MATSRTILHVDMDSFYAAIEQRDHPEYRGKPVIVGGQGPRGVVATASYEARRFGVHSALPGSLARERCPQGIFVAPRMRVYAAESQRIFSIFRQYTPLVEPLSLDEAFLDVTGSRMLFGDGLAIARSIKEQVHHELGLCVSVGIATNKFLAKIASDLDKPDGLVQVPEGEERDFLADLPISRLWGLGPKSQEKLENLGLFRIQQLQDLDLDRCVQIFGENMGRHFHELAHGRDCRPVSTGGAAKSISHETTFGVDIPPGPKTDGILLEFSEAVGLRLRRKGLRGQVVRLKVRFPPFETHSRQRRMQTPTADDLEIYRTASELLRAANPEARHLRLIGVGVSDLVPEGTWRQTDLFAGPDPRARRALDAMDRIRERHGGKIIRHGTRKDQP